jgi:hypothetical protein
VVSGRVSGGGGHCLCRHDSDLCEAGADESRGSGAERAAAAAAAGEQGGDCGRSSDAPGGPTNFATVSRMHRAISSTAVDMVKTYLHTSHTHTASAGLGKGECTLTETRGGKREQAQLDLTR